MTANKSLQAFDGSISLVRLTGMVCIILCHVFAWLGQNVLSQLFNVGVPLFLLISGYLYADKEVPPFSFLKKRWIKLTIPVLVFVLALALYCWIAHVPNVHFLTIPLYVFNLQGMSFLCGHIPYAELCSGAGHLWFLTVLTVCYICMLAVKQAEKVFNWRMHSFIAFWIGSSLFIAVCFPLQIYLQYLQIFFIGYGYGKDRIHMRPKIWLLLSGLMLLCIAARFLAHRYIDNSPYYLLVAALTHNILAVWIFASFRLVYARKKMFIDKIAQIKWVRHADSISFDVYIVHYMFLVGPLEIQRLSGGAGMQLLLFILLTFLVAETLFWTTKPILKRI